MQYTRYDSFSVSYLDREHTRYDSFSVSYLDREHRLKYMAIMYNLVKKHCSSVLRFSKILAWHKSQIN